MIFQYFQFFQIEKDLDEKGYDYVCKNFKNEFAKNSWPRNNLCQYCKDKDKIIKSITYFFCDIRIFDDDKQVYICGVFPGMKIFPKSLLISDDFENENYDLTHFLS